LENPNKREIIKSTTVAFDLDGTLCSQTDGNYEFALPFRERIEHVNYLYSTGIRVLIFTARGASSGKDLRDMTLIQLRDWGILFDELIMGKPHFDLLVDDKAVSDIEFFKFGRQTPSDSIHDH
jgi:hypothetical protein